MHSTVLGPPVRAATSVLLSRMSPYKTLLWLPVALGRNADVVPTPLAKSSLVQSAVSSAHMPLPGRSPSLCSPLA